MYRLLLFSTFFCIFLACAKPARQPVISFYYWKTSVEPGVLLGEPLLRFSPAEAPIFLHFLDVDYSAGYDGPVPIGELRMETVAVERPVVPVVFITNRLFMQSRPEQVDSLAAKVARKIRQRLDDLAEKARWKALEQADDVTRAQIESHRDSFAEDWIQRFVPEIQIDCDWTPGTRAAYFHFLEAFKKQAIAQRRTLSCTVRLHQFRERKENGIPPVQRGTLMCYNMANPQDTAVQNAIFDLSLLKGYIEDQPGYPLPLDIALPVFSWGAWFRSGEFRGLLSGWDAELLDDTTNFYSLGNNLYRLRRDTVWAGDYLREGDLVRLDAPAEDDLLASKSLLQPLFGADSRLLFFDWDTTKIAQYERLIPQMRADY